MRIRWRNFELPTSVTRDDQSYTDTYGRFIVEPFQRGFGTTIGNGLRRVLLSSIEGTAITWVKIDGADHEFSSLDGVYEDVTDIILKLKRLRVRLEEAEESTIKLTKQGPGDVMAGDFQTDQHTTILSPDLHICTLTSDTTFHVEAGVARGRGYSPSDERIKGDLPVGHIPVDAIYSPVYRVKYGIEATRVGKYTNYDRLVLEIWTDGTVSPEMALVEAAKVYRKHLNPFVQYFDDQEKKAVGSEPVLRESREAPEASTEQDATLDQSIDVLGLSVRAKNCLDSDTIRTIRELVRHTETELLSIRNFGQTSLVEVTKKLEERNLRLGMNV
ncbi:MAG: DNA-directed RNA polymerase subunit alpha [Planctomycetes bacterium]|nr:DNA-directed RNA polymerase subunit alpha [Planctomycetota bacterium]